MIDYRQNQADKTHILSHFKNCDFVPPLEEYLDVDNYINKILKNAVRFECWDGVELVGFVAAYCNDRVSKTGFVTLVSVDRLHGRRGIAQTLLGKMERHCIKSGFKKITLEVYKDNLPAIRLYEKCGFVFEKESGGSIIMFKEI